MSLVGFPLLLLPFAVYNMIAFLLPGVGFAAPVTRNARSPGPGLRRLAGLYVARAARAPEAANCLRSAP